MQIPAEPKCLKLAEIKTDLGTQARALTCNDVVGEYAERNLLTQQAGGVSMLIPISILITVVVVFMGIEAANCVAYGHFACRRHEPHIYCELQTGYLSSLDCETIIAEFGFIATVPLSLLSDFYYEDVAGNHYRILRFTKLHREIERKFQQLQSV